MDDDVARLIDDAVHRDRSTIKQVVNDALRTALKPAFAERERYVLPVFHAGLQPGIDPAGMNRLADELEDEALAAQWKRDS